MYLLLLTLTPTLFSISKTHSVIKIKQIRIVLSVIGLAIGYDFSHVFADVGPFRYQIECLDAPALVLRAEELEPAAEPVLDDSVVACDPVALTCLVAFEDHRRVSVIKVWFEPALVVVPENISN